MTFASSDHPPTTTEQFTKELGLNLKPPTAYERITYDLADHEVYFQFNGDTEAIAFRAWWNLIGEGTFMQWLKENYEDYV